MSTVQTPRTLTPIEHAELLAVYDVVIGDISFWKSQQWKVTNYAALMYAAIVGTAKIFDDASVLVTASTGILLFVAFIVFLLGLYVLDVLEESLKKSRERLARIVNAFEPYIRDSILHPVEPAQEKKTLIRLFQFVLAAGLIFVFAILWIWKCGI